MQNAQMNILPVVLRPMTPVRILMIFFQGALFGNILLVMDIAHYLLV